jgi:hypothetical protein
MARVAVVRVRISSFDLLEQPRDELELEPITESDDPVFDEVAEHEEDLGMPLALLTLNHG